MIALVTEADLAELLPLVHGYCSFYQVAPAETDLLTMSRSLIDDPEREGVQLIARDTSAAAVGFATIFWSWGTLTASRIGVMHDLFVAEAARGNRIGEALIVACLEHCRQHGASSLTWQTALDNTRAQRLYDRIGARRAQWLDYSLAT